MGKGLRMSEPKGSIRIDRQRGGPRGYAHHAEEQRLPPPGHAERIAAHTERVDRELARLGFASSSSRAGRPRVPGSEQRVRREQIVRHLAAAKGEVIRPDLMQLLDVGTWILWRLLRHPWFHVRQRVRKGAPKGGGHLPSIVSLTPEGRASAQRLAREGGVL
jgi:hypothetical protein